MEKQPSIVQHLQEHLQDTEIIIPWSHWENTKSVQIKAIYGYIVESSSISIKHILVCLTIFVNNIILHVFL